MLTKKGQKILEKFIQTYKSISEGSRIFSKWRTETKQKGLGRLAKAKRKKR